MSNQLTIANFNLRNWIRASSDIEQYYFYSPGRHNYYSAAQFKEKSAWVQQQLIALDADIVAFQECFDETSLLACIRGTDGHADSKLITAPLDEKTRETQGSQVVFNAPRVAIAYRSTWRCTHWVAHQRFPENLALQTKVSDGSNRDWRMDLQCNDTPLNQFNRAVIEAHFESSQYPEQRICVFAAHLKSKRPLAANLDGDLDLAQYVIEDAVGRARSLMIRTIEACAIRALTANQIAKDPSVPVLVIGDLNDSPRSVSTHIAGGDEVPSIHSDLVEDHDQRQRQRMKLGDYQLHSALEMQTRKSHRDVLYTHVYNGHYDVLDHVFVSNHLVPKWMRDRHGGTQQSIGRVGSLRVYNDHLLNTELDDLSPREVGQSLHTLSDHGQLSCRVEFDSRST
ncbi:MAG: hypothetical protein HWE20_00315 [Gammaproteobacteria bacterium]|nr:hypothetical protein [Gammaproteobacteria bacterium]